MVIKNEDNLLFSPQFNVVSYLIFLDTIMAFIVLSLKHWQKTNDDKIVRTILYFILCKNVLFFN